jgi:type II secretory pathway component PulF
MAGERAGNLDDVIRRYVGYEKVIGAVRRRTISALIYPMILVVMMTALIGIIVLRVVPAFSDFYSNFGKELPLSTRVIVGISNLVVGNIWLIIARGAAGAARASLPGCSSRADASSSTA